LNPAIPKERIEDKMKSIYDRKDLQTAESQEFGIKIDKAIQPILDEYLKKGFSIRNLSHEAQNIIRDCELDYIMGIHMKDAKRASKRLKKKRGARDESLLE